MSIDELLDTIDDWSSQIAHECPTFSGRDSVFREARQIRALLKAGQAMRYGLGRDGSADDTLDDIYIVDDIKLALAVEAWDAATKKGDV